MDAVRKQSQEVAASVKRVGSPYADPPYKELDNISVGVTLRIDLEESKNITQDEMKTIPENEKKKKKHLITNPETFMHLIKGNVGTGILAMPDAIKNSGWALGVGGIIFIAILCIYCMHRLLRASKRLREKIGKEYLSYADTAEKSMAHTEFGPIKRQKNLPKIFKAIINAFLCITQLGFCSVYFVFVSRNIKPVLDDVIGDFDIRLYCTILLLPILALASIRNLKILAPFITLANAFNITGIVFIFYFLFRDIKPIAQRQPIGSISTLPLFFGTAMYTFEGIALVLPIEKEMKSRKSMRGPSGVLNIGMILVSTFYVLMGFFGYLEFGDEVKGSISISIINANKTNGLALAINVMLALSVFLSYALQFFVPFEIIYKAVEHKISKKRKLLWEFLIRYGLVLLTFGAAVLIPDLSLFMALVGAMSSSTLALMAPAIIDTLSTYPDFGPFKIKLFLNGFIFVFGVVGCVAGTFVSVMDAIEHFGGE